MKKINEMMFVYLLSLDIAINIFVDMDGTVLDSSLDNEFKRRCEEDGFDITIKWYRKCNVSNLNINIELIEQLIALKDKGHNLVLWTNRGLENKEMTKNNLKEYWNIFNEYQFHSGMKSKCQLDGVVIDNEEKYLSCGTKSVLIKHDN